MEISPLKLILFSLLALASLELVNGACGPAGAIRCDTCDAEEPPNCLTCPTRTQLNVAVSPKTCISCFQDCLTCNRSDAPCSQCRPSNGPDPTNIGACAPCDTRNCTGKCIVNGAGKCDICVGGYGLGPELTCAACPVNCQTCGSVNTSFCDVCYRGYTVVAGACRGCAPNCTKCDTAGEGKCDECDAGYTLKEPEKTCSQCPVNCDKCDNPGPTGCDPDGCKEGYGPNDQGVCQPCAPNCTKCDTAGAGKCDPDGCPADLIPGVDGKCQECAPNCTKCDTAGPGKCDPDGCIGGLAPDVNGICQACAPNCTKCDTAGPGQCDPDGCPAGLQFVDGKCQVGLVTTSMSPSTPSMMPTTGGSTTGGQGGSTTGGQGGSTTGGQGGSSTVGQDVSPTGDGSGGSTTGGGQSGPDDGDGSGDNGLKGGKLIGLIIGIVAGVLAASLFILCCWVCWPDVCNWRDVDNNVVVVSKRNHQYIEPPTFEPAPSNYPWNYRRHTTTIIADNY